MYGVMAWCKIPFCIEKKNSWGRKNVFVGVTILACCIVVIMTLAGAASLANYMGSNNELDYHAGDVINLNNDVNDFSTILCAQYDVEAVSSQANMYLLPRKVNLQPRKTKNVSETIRGLGPNRQFIDRAYTFLPGSTIDVSVCLDHGTSLEVLLIKGDNNMNHWKRDRKCVSCFWKKRIVDLQTNCSNNNYVTLRGVVREKDTYHFVITRAKKQEGTWARCTAQIHASRSMYDVSHSTQKCTAKSSCVFSLKYNTHPDIIVDFPSHQNSSNRASLKTHCRKRIFVWLGLLLVLPVSLILFILLFMTWLYHSPNCKSAVRENFVTIVLDQF